jgi:hypothetical protein
MMLHQVLLTSTSAMHSPPLPSCEAVQLVHGSRLYCTRLETILVCQCLAPGVPSSLHS